MPRDFINSPDGLIGVNNVIFSLEVLYRTPNNMKMTQNKIKCPV